MVLILKYRMSDKTYIIRVSKSTFNIWTWFHKLNNQIDGELSFFYLYFKIIFFHVFFFPFVPSFAKLWCTLNESTFYQFPNEFNRNETVKINKDNFWYWNLNWWKLKFKKRIVECTRVLPKNELQEMHKQKSAKDSDRP